MSSFSAISICFRGLPRFQDFSTPFFLAVFLAYLDVVSLKPFTAVDLRWRFRFNHLFDFSKTSSSLGDLLLVNGCVLCRNQNFTQ